MKISPKILTGPYIYLSVIIHCFILYEVAMKLSNITLEIKVHVCAALLTNRSWERFLINSYSVLNYSALNLKIKIDL